jgi:hypothetical protein
MQACHPRANRQRRHQRPFAPVLVVATLWMQLACGGNEPAVVSPPDRAAAQAGAAHIVVIDVDALGSVEAAAHEAALGRGAPGEAEPRQYLVHAARSQDAQAVAVALVERGFTTAVAAEAATR